MKTMQLLAGALAGAVALSVPVFAIGAAPAVSSAALDQDKMQLSADQRARAREEARLQTDRHTLAADTRSGKMSAMSEDSEKIYKDQQYIKGEKADIAHDKAGALQMKSDRDALWREEKQLTSDRTKLREDTESGKMSATSDDAERVYRDQQAEGSQWKQIRADRAKLAADEKARTASRADHNRVSAIEASVAAAQIDLGQAIAAAERHVQGKAVKAELENGNGQLAYEVEVLKGNRLFDVKVHSRNGNIIASADEAGRDRNY